MFVAAFVYLLFWDACSMDGGFQSHTVMRELTLHRELSAQAAWELGVVGFAVGSNNLSLQDAAFQKE